MNSKMTIDLGPVQFTLFMPVWARAVETQKARPMLIDKAAVTIINTVDVNFTHMTQNISEISQIAWIARCKRFDEIIRNFITQHPTGTIVNIGCGLDTTYERIHNPSIYWYDLDLPDVIALRRKFFTETEKRIFLASSFLEPNWFERIKVLDTVLFIATGVFPYFEERAIKGVLLKIADTFPKAELFFDVTSPKGVEVANAVIQKAGLDATSYFKWGVKDKAVILSWDKRLHLIHSYKTFQIKGLQLSLKNKLLGFISDALDIQYMLHVKIVQ